jgi:hypothetical protein
MGIKGIRTALKVDLIKHAREQPGLHVCFVLLLAVALLIPNRTDGIQKVCQVMTFQL